MLKEKTTIPADEMEICLKLLSLFQLDGKPVSEIATKGEIEIFHAIVFRHFNRVEIICSTQYGKSLFVALACIVATCIQHKVVAVVAPDNDKAKIIMRYYIEHLGDNILFYSQLEKNTRLERLRMEESKERIILRNNGGIFILSAQAKNSQKGFAAAMGAGAELVITDESSLLPDQIEATIFRMIAGKPEAFYCKIGNPFYRNHFFKSSKDPNYYQIRIDYRQGLAEGRYTMEFIEEAKKKPFFDILFDCEFPPEDTIDEKGYLTLFTEAEVIDAQRNVEPFGERRLGIDVAEGGGDYNAFGLRTANFATLLDRFQESNTMTVPGMAIMYAKELEVFDQNVFMDTIGVGKGAYDRLVEQRYHITSVKFSEKASDPTQFINLRAECYWLLKKWIREGGALDPDCDWSQLPFIKYKVDSSGRLQIMPKEELRKVMGESPDVPDAIAMTFARKAVLNKSRESVKEERQLLKEFDFHKQKQFLTGSRYLRRK